MSQAHAAVISPREGEAPQRACSPRGDFPRAARTGVLLAVMLIVFLSACGSSSTPDGERLADDSGQRLSGQRLSGQRLSGQRLSGQRLSVRHRGDPL